MGGTSYEKVQGALHGVGISVLGGALTTGEIVLPDCPPTFPSGTSSSCMCLRMRDMYVHLSVLQCVLVRVRVRGCAAP